MNTNQRKYTAFMEGVCKEFNHPEMIPALKEGFRAFCEAITPDAPAFGSIGIYNSMRLTTDEMLLLQEMRQYYKDLCRDGWMSDFLHGGGNPLSAADNLAMLDALVEMYGSVEELPEGFLALYHKLGGKKI